MAALSTLASVTFPFTGVACGRRPSTRWRAEASLPLSKDLWTVGARDARLHEQDATRTKMTGHCLRDTGLTHMAVRGDNPIVIQWRGGHTDFKMTQGYIDRGRVDARRIGVPLPPMPSESAPRRAVRV
jgi:integrase